jgi:predicted transposase/invertase (TIGR01784 family)
LSFVKEKVQVLMNFLKYYVRFNDENSITFENEINKITGKTLPMGIEQFLLERATAQGIEKGIEKEKVEVILSLFEDKFEIPFIAKAVRLSENEVEKILIDRGKLINNT